MPGIYTRNCDNCNKEYTSCAKHFCSKSCARIFQWKDPKLRENKRQSMLGNKFSIGFVNYRPIKGWYHSECILRRNHAIIILRNNSTGKFIKSTNPFGVVGKI